MSRVTTTSQNDTLPAADHHQTPEEPESLRDDSDDSSDDSDTNDHLEIA